MPRWDAIGFFCEDVRQEMNNVETLIGIMPDNVAIEGVGGFLPKLGMYVRIHVTPDIDIESISVSVDFFNGEHRQEIGAFSRDQIEEEKRKIRISGGSLIGFICRGLLSPFPVPHHGPVRLKVRIGEEEIICGGIRFVEPAITSSTASPQPPSQSPPAAPAS